MKFKHQDICINKNLLDYNDFIFYSFHYVIENNKKDNTYKLKVFTFDKNARKMLSRTKTIKYNGTYFDLECALLKSNKPIKEFESVCKEYLENLIFK